MKQCIKCGNINTRPTKLCNRCYNNQPNQIKKRRERDRRYYKKLSNKWKQERSKLKCERCGKIFSGNRSDQKYCSITCQLGLKTIKERSLENCVICGNKFEQKRRDSKACSPKCIRKWEYLKRNKDKKRFYERTREGKIRTGGGKFSFKEWESMKIKYNRTCPKCKKTEPEISLTIDHITPVSLNGKHCKENIQPLCLICNITKGNYYIKKYECTT